MEYTLIYYSKWSSSRKAKDWLIKKNIDFVERPIKEENPCESELKSWFKKSRYPLKRFFNTSSALYKNLNLKEKLEHMSEEEQIKLLSTDGMLVKKPILIGEDVVLLGFNENVWWRNLLLSKNETAFVEQCHFCGASEGEISERTYERVKKLYYCPRCQNIYCDQCSYEKVKDVEKLQLCLRCDSKLNPL